MMHLPFPQNDILEECEKYLKQLIGQISFGLRANILKV